MQPLAYEPITVDGPPEGLRQVPQRASCAMAAEQTGSPARNPPNSPATAFRHRLPMRPDPTRLLRRISVSPSSILAPLRLTIPCRAPPTPPQQTLFAFSLIEPY